MVQPLQVVGTGGASNHGLAVVKRLICGDGGGGSSSEDYALMTCIHLRLVAMVLTPVS